MKILEVNLDNEAEKRAALELLHGSIQNPKVEAFAEYISEFLKKERLSVADGMVIAATLAAFACREKGPSNLGTAVSVFMQMFEFALNMLGDDHELITPDTTQSIN